MFRERINPLHCTFYLYYSDPALRLPIKIFPSLPPSLPPSLNPKRKSFTEKGVAFTQRFIRVGRVKTPLHSRLRLHPNVLLTLRIIFAEAFVSALI